MHTPGYAEGHYELRKLAIATPTLHYSTRNVLTYLDSAERINVATSFDADCSTARLVKSKT